MSWHHSALDFQATIRRSIPEKWKIEVDDATLDVRDIPTTCGVLSARQCQITSLTASELAREIASGALSSVDATEAFCARCAIAHQLTNCLTEFFPEEAMQQAQALDEHFQKTGKPVGPLHGVPVSLKEMLDLAGKRSPYGLISWKDAIAEEDAGVVKLLRAAGAVFYCKTTMPQGGMALETASPLCGRTTNPRNRNLVAGGSSGGEAALISLRGSPVGPGTDIGGSIRIPAAFNGLYGLRPTAPRIPHSGLRHVDPGNLSVPGTTGPIAQSMEDIKMFTKVINAHPHGEYEPGAVSMPWRDVCSKSLGKLSLGIMRSDGVVEVHPPIRRAMEETAQKLRAAGHDVIEFEPPFDCWEVSKTAHALYFQSGGAQLKNEIRKSGEPLLPAVKFIWDTYKTTELTGTQLTMCNCIVDMYKTQFANAWKATEKKTATGRPMDGLICPVAPCVGFPHGQPIWWGYTTLFNVVDYPSTVFPIKDFVISAESDPKNLEYQPRDNPFDKTMAGLYDPELYKSQPVCLQLVGRPYKDEDVVAVTEVVDEIMNPRV